MFKHLIKSTVRSLGFEIRRPLPPAPGQDWIADLQRLFHPRPATVIFDIGANVGQTSLRLATAFPPPATIVAFEPASATFAQLSTAVARFAHVLPQQFAVGDQPGRLRLHHGSNSQLNRFVPVASVSANTHEEVTVTTVDAAARTLGLVRIDLLKTDTEGYEGAVLRGASGLLQQGGIRAVLAEASFESAPDLHTSFDEIRALLEPHGFCLHRIYDCEHWGLRLKFCNVLFLHEASFSAA